MLEQPRSIRFSTTVSAIDATMLKRQPEVRKRIAMRATMCG
jgi:hypothetical protein